MMRALISTRADRYENSLQTIDGLSRDWYQWFEAMQIRPYLMSNSTTGVEAYFATIDPEVVILTGGNDVLSVAGQSSWDEDRNVTELQLIEHALDRKIPIFGVCRGLQLLNHYFGGTLSDLDQYLPKRAHICTCHTVEIASQYQEPLKTTVAQVNSYHRFGLFNTDLADNLSVIAICQKDGNVEAFEDSARRVMAVQWHPERPDSDNLLSRQLFNLLINA